MDVPNLFRQNLATLQGLLKSWVSNLIHEQRPMWRDDGVDIGRGDIYDVHGTCTKSGDVITITSVVGAGDSDTLDSLHAAAFTSPKYLVTEADANLTAEVVVGTTPGGELGGTWGTPTVDATHSGNAHHAAVTVAADLSPLITLSTQELSFAVQNANKVLAGPTSGGDADPTMRALVAADIPSLTAYVPKTLYDAQSILAATADDTPAAVTVAEQRLVGRLTGGNIDDITIGIADDNILQVDQYDAADNDYAKFTANGIEGRSYAEVISDLGLTTVATDVIWDAAGDLAVGSGANTASKLTKGADGKVLTMVAGAVAWAAAAGGGAMATDPLWDAAGDLAVGTGADTGAKLALTVPGAANLLNVLGVVNGESTPAWKVLFDGTAPEAIGTAAAGTGIVAAHRNHVHALPAAQNDRVIACFINPNPASTTLAKFITPPIPFAFTFVKVDLKAPDSEQNNSLDNLDVIVDVHLQTAANADTHTSTTIFATQGNRPLISYLPSGTGHIQGSTTTFDTAGGAAGDRLYIYCDQTASLTGLHVNITIRPTP